MADASIRNATANQLTVDYQRNRLSLMYTDTVRRDYANISGSEESAVIGTLMGVVAATGKYVPMQSNASNGSQVPVAILFQNIEAAEAAAEIDNILLLNSGDVNSNLLVFAKEGDTLDTLVASAGGDTKSVRDWLIQNCKSLKLVAVEDSSEFDN